MNTLFYRALNVALFLTGILFSLHAVEIHDLLKMKQDFVLETKQIKIPGYQDAFNPSIVRWKGELLMCFRIRDPITLSSDQIGLVTLDEDFNPKGSPTVLQRNREFLLRPSRAQDPRLIIINENLFVVYSNIIELNGQPVRRMFSGQIQFNNSGFIVEAPEPLLYFTDENPNRPEKNWVPFEYDKIMLMAYSIQPHRVLLPWPSVGYCETVGDTLGNFKWNWGTIRGGTPALKVDNNYLAFFHSLKGIVSVQSNEVMMTHYFIGAYTFDPEPPFAVNAVSPHPIVGNSFYQGPMYKTWKPLRVVFPGGYVFDENFIWIVYGRQDHESWVVKLDKNKLLESLVPVN